MSYIKISRCDILFSNIDLKKHFLKIYFKFIWYNINIILFFGAKYNKIIYVKLEVSKIILNKLMLVF